MTVPTVPDSSSQVIRVVLADDDPVAREMVADLLSALGHEVVATAAGGREAVGLALEHHPDAVLLDVHMPDGSGLDAAVELARALPGTAVVLVSGDAELRLTDIEVYESTAVAYLPKPVPPASLDATIRLAVARGRSLAAARREAVEARGALEERKIVERAKGVLMRRMGATEQEAYAVLRRSSQDRSLPMVEIARAVLASEPT
ncbi:MAG TPA: response regulator [Gemmatimonadales bacterium]